MNRIESAAQTLAPGAELEPLMPVEPLSCAVAVWRAVTRLATAERATAEREFARATSGSTRPWTWSGMRRRPEERP
jgi:hypothetical protein